MGTNNGEYDSPLIYDAEYGGYQDDFDLFLNLIDQGKVLDLACGTGRLTIPLARKGLHVTGLEISQPMLQRAQEKAAGLDIKWLQGDITDFEIDTKFDLVTLAGNSFQALLTSEDQMKLLRCVRTHLKSTGLFIFDTRNAQPSELKSTDDFEYWHAFQDFSGKTVKVYGKQTYNTEQKIVTYVTKRHWGDHETISNVQLRYADLQDILVLLGRAGLKPLNIYGDYLKANFGSTSKSIIIVCTSVSNATD